MKWLWKTQFLNRSLKHIICHPQFDFNDAEFWTEHIAWSHFQKDWSWEQVEYHQRTCGMSVMFPDYAAYRNSVYLKRTRLNNWSLWKTITHDAGFGEVAINAYSSHPASKYEIYHCSAVPVRPISFAILFTKTLCSNVSNAAERSSKTTNTPCCLWRLVMM